MLAMRGERAGVPGWVLWLVVLLTVAAGFMFAAVQSEVTVRSHAVSKHGITAATFARACSADGRVRQVWGSSQRGTFAEVCELDPADWMDEGKRWTIRVIDRVTGEEITVFSHEGSYMSLEEYLLRQEYMILQ